MLSQYHKIIFANPIPCASFFVRLFGLRKRKVDFFFFGGETSIPRTVCR